MYALQKFAAVKQYYMALGRDVRLKTWKVPIVELEGTAVIAAPEEALPGLDLSEQDIAYLDANINESGEN